MKKAYLSPELKGIRLSDVMLESMPVFLGTDGDWGYSDDFTN